MNKSACKAVLIATLLMPFSGSASSETGIDPETPDGQAKIAEFKEAYALHCYERIERQTNLKDSPLGDDFLKLFKITCSCGAERGMSKFTSEDYRTIELALDNVAATSRLDEATAECNDLGMKASETQQ